MWYTEIYELINHIKYYLKSSYENHKRIYVVGGMNDQNRNVDKSITHNICHHQCFELLRNYAEHQNIIKLISYEQ